MSRKSPIARHIFALAVACLVGALVPVLAAFYDGWRRYQGSAASSWIDQEWRAHFIPAAIFTAEGSALVGLVVGGFGVWYLRSRRQTTLRHFAFTGCGLGAVCGALFAEWLHEAGDPPIAWLIFIMLPAIAMALGFTCYWFIALRPHAA